MLRSAGLYSYIKNNNIKSGLMLVGFLVIVQLMMAAILCLASAYMGGAQTYDSFVAGFLQLLAKTSLPVLGASLVWVGLAFTQFKRIMREATSLHPTTRRDEPRLYNIVENLCISVGFPTPTIEISESPALNAFAMGLSPASSTIGVTRGLLNSLNDQELEAVIAHEVTHIQAHDVRLLTFATIFCGIIFSFGWFTTYRIREAYRNLRTQGLGGSVTLRGAIIAMFMLPILVVSIQQFRIYAAALALMFIILALLASLGLRLAISRTREFVADAGAVELTKNPEALISALIKIEGRSLIDGGDIMLRSMMISAPSHGLSSTHPPIEHRIDAIVTYAAERLRGLKLAPAEQRNIPPSNENGMVAGFSISKMKYPAWISKPTIVLPSLFAGGLLYLITQGSLVDVITSTPQWISDFWSPPNGGMVRFDHDHPLPQSGGVFEGFGMGDFKATLFELLFFAFIAFIARKLIKHGFIKQDEGAHQFMGKPSKIMQSDWDDEAPAPNPRIILAAGVEQQRQSQQTHQGPMFGQKKATTFNARNFKAAPVKSQEGLLAIVKEITSQIPSKVLIMGFAVPAYFLFQYSGLMPTSGGFEAIAPANDTFNVSNDVEKYILAKVKSNHAELSDAIQRAAFNCAYDLYPSPAARKIGEHWAQEYSGVLAMAGFEAGRFPTQKEIEDQLVQHGNGNYITPKGANELEGYQEFFNQFNSKGLSGSSARNECVFNGAYKAMGGPPILHATL